MLNAKWTCEVTNYTKGWTFTTYAGKSDTPQLSPADPVVLQAPYKGSWGWSDYPAGWTPRQAQLDLRVYSAQALEAMGGVDPGDLVDAHLFHEQLRSVTFGPVVRKSWHRVVGYLDDPEVKQDDRGLVVSLAVVDPLARLAEVVVDDPNPWPAESLGARLNRIAQAAGINIVSKSAYAAAATLGPVTVSNQGALPLLQATLDGVLSGGKQLVLRGTVGELEHAGLGDQVDFDTTYSGADPVWLVDPATLGTSLYPGKPVYWISTVTRVSTMQAPFVLTAAHDLLAPPAAPGTGLWVAQRTPIANLADVSGGAALDADDVLREGTAWIKSRSTAINQVKLVGLDAAGEEKSVVAQYTDLVRADGPSTRVVQTHRLIDAGALAAATALLPDKATASPDWSADQFTFTTKALTAAEVRAYATTLFPYVHTADMTLPIAIVGVATRGAVTGADLSGVLEGATVQVDAKGVLSVIGQLRNEVLRPSGSKTNLVSYSELRTETADNAPTIAWSTFGYHSDDAVPYTGTDRTFDASQAHPSFGHEVLSYRDFRLIGVNS